MAKESELLFVSLHVVWQRPSTAADEPGSCKCEALSGPIVTSFPTCLSCKNFWYMLESVRGEISHLPSSLLFTDGVTLT